MKTEADVWWAAVMARDRAFDGAFVYSVQTTGVYCKPSCGARRARPENVRFHATCGEAEGAGFRACKRCRPDVTPDSVVAEVCRWILAAEGVPRLEELAARAGMSASHLHRLFKAETGLTPRAFAVAERARRVRAALGTGEPVTEAFYEAGYGSSGRFYAAADAALGMKPAAFRDGGARADVTYAVSECSLGLILVARSERGVCSILLGDEAEALVRSLREQFPRASLVPGDESFAALVAQVVDCLEAPGKASKLPLDIQGTAFQQRVWEALRRIPAGTVASYSEVARMIGAPAAARAVARACASNVLAVAIPCHRVVRNDGALSGYRWGVARKRALLDREASA